MNTWYGLKPDGSQVAIEHAKLMDWAYKHDMQFQVGWSHAIEMPDGTRLSRTKAAAEEKGWLDVAKAPFAPPPKGDE